MSTDTQKKSSLTTKIKGLLGVEDDVKLKPMIAYNSAIFFSGGGPYVLGCYLLPFLTKVEGLSTAQYGTVALFSCVCDAITDPLMGHHHRQNKTQRRQTQTLSQMGRIACSYCIFSYVELFRYIGGSSGIRQHHSRNDLLHLCLYVL